MKSGKCMLEYKQTLKMIRHGKTKLTILTNNCQSLRKSERKYYALLAKTGAYHHYSSNNIEMGTACGKYSRLYTLVIINAGDSRIIRSMPGQTGEKKMTQNFSLIKLVRACFKNKNILKKSLLSIEHLLHKTHGTLRFIYCITITFNPP
ncbi:unnamed protein product [Nyctereutes procyonoides]|uniref:Large ribosomal subunit protein eL30 n=1 Tax=Nyctereutes procyonoides TaxID=34880 RepID=A0A811Z8U0_NYCPR|nr:unnamed protein product [Nyctereutes procyonoides]